MGIPKTLNITSIYHLAVTIDIIMYGLLPVSGTIVFTQKFLKELDNLIKDKHGMD